MAGIELGIAGLDECRVIGAGGFATVYSALDVRFGRTVAVKVLVNVDEDGRRRFDREQLSMGKLSDHAHVVTAFSSGFTTGGQPYIIMEHLSGGSLADKIDRGETLPWDRAARYATAIAKALDHAHSQGVLHRDVKPENILLSSDGMAKLADFGIASIREGAATQAVGFSLAHSPPETFQGGEDNRDERADLYSLASTLLTLVRGQPPYESPGGNSQMAYMMRISDNPIPQLGDLRYDNFLATAMAKDRDDRFQNANQFIDALATTLLPIEEQPWLTTTPKTTTVDPAPPPHPSSTTTAVFDDSTTDAITPPTDSAGEPVATSDTSRFDQDPSNHDESPNANPVEPNSQQSDQDQHPALAPSAQLQPPAVQPPRPPEHPGNEGEPANQSGEVQMAEIQSTPKKFQKQDGVLESASTVLAEPTPATGVVRKERQKGVIVAAIVGLLLIAAFLAYLLRPAPQEIETSSSDPAVEVDEQIRSADASNSAAVNGAAGVVGPHTDAVNDLIALGDGRFVSTSADGSVLVWNANDDELDPTGFIAGTGLTITHSLVLDDGRVASRRSDDAAVIWDPDNLGGEPVVFEGRAGDGGLVKTESGFIVSVDPDATALVVWDPDDLESPTVSAADSSIEAFEPHVELAADGNSIVTASENFQLTMWTIDEDGQATIAPEALAVAHTATINDLMILSDGAVASASDDGTVIVQRPGGGSDSAIVFDGHPSDVVDLVQFDDGRIGSAGQASSIVWNPMSPKWVPNESNTGLISRLGRATEQAVLSDERLAIASFKDVVVWDPNLPTPSPVATESFGSKTHEGNVTAVLAIDNGKLASADDTGAVVVWAPDDNN